VTCKRNRVRFITKKACLLQIMFITYHYTIKIKPLAALKDTRLNVLPVVTKYAFRCFYFIPFNMKFELKVAHILCKNIASKSPASVPNWRYVDSRYKLISLDTRLHTIYRAHV